MREDVIEALFNLIREQKPRIESHSIRVSQLCRKIGHAMDLTGKDISELKFSGLLHDIGKIAIDDKILEKKGTLTETEWAVIKRHSDYGFLILSTFPDLSEIAYNVLFHHERIDGKGYPGGIVKDRIPLFSRIIAVADSYDAMTTERVYKKALTTSMAVRELERNKGSQFDPKVVDLFIDKVICGEVEGRMKKQFEDELDTQKGIFLKFMLGKEAYAIETSFVTEIIGVQTITELPDMPDYFKGVINIRGQIIPLMDVRLRFKMKSLEYTQKTCIVIIEVKGISLGIIVDSVSEVLSIPDDKIVPPPDINDGSESRFVSALGILGENVKLILDCDKLLTCDEAEEISRAV